MSQNARITPAVAYAAGRDAGNRSMRAGGRAEWNDDDWNVAAELTATLLQMIATRRNEP